MCYILDSNKNIGIFQSDPRSARDWRSLVFAQNVRPVGQRRVASFQGDILVFLDQSDRGHSGGVDFGCWLQEIHCSISVTFYGN